MPIGRYDLVPESVKGRPVIGRERPTSTSHQQCASRHIPRSQPLLPISIQASTSHVRQIERCGTSTTHALGGQVQGHELTVVVISRCGAGRTENRWPGAPVATRWCDSQPDADHSARLVARAGR